MEQLQCIFDMILKYLPIAVLIGGAYKFYKQHEFNKDIQMGKLQADKELQEHSRVINGILEQQKFDHQRLLAEFSLYAAKRQEKYIQLANRMHTAMKEISCISSGIQRVRTFKDYDEKDVEIYLENLKVVCLTEKMKEEIKECWKNDPQKGIQELQALDKKFKDIRAYNAVLDLRDSYLDALLFLPDKLSENLEQYITTMINFALEIKDGHELGKKSNKSGWAGTVEELEEKTKKLTKDMQQELQK